MLSVGITLVGIYVPSNASTEEKRDRKNRFIEATGRALDASRSGPTLLLADLNSVPSTHPPVPFMDPVHSQWVDALLAGWTDCIAADPGPTWFSWKNEAYRYDYCLARNLTVIGGERIMKLRAQGLSDHAGTWCTIESPIPDTELKKKKAWTF
jgi:endonuclease/exonuclease/phosphatase family metal-dependent hydrolase